MHFTQGDVRRLEKDYRISQSNRGVIVNGVMTEGDTTTNWTQLNIDIKGKPSP